MRNVKSILLIIVIGVLTVWLLGALYLRLNANDFLFNEVRSYSVSKPEAAEQLFVSAPFENIDVWRLENTEHDRVILQLHGQSGRQRQMLKRLHEYGTVIAPAYAGFSHSQGKPSRKSTKQTVIATYDWLINEQNVDPQNITVIGYSLGSSPALYLGTQRSGFSELVIIGGYSSIAGMCTRDYGPFCIFAGDVFPNAKWARRVDVPVRQFHVRSDEQVPLEEGRRLNKAFTDEVKLQVLDDYTHSYPNLEPIFSEK